MTRFSRSNRCMKKWHKIIFGNIFVYLIFAGFNIIYNATASIAKIHRKQVQHKENIDEISSNAELSRQGVKNIATLIRFGHLDIKLIE